MRMSSSSRHALAVLVLLALGGCSAAFAQTDARRVLVTGSEAGLTVAGLREGHGVRAYYFGDGREYSTWAAGNRDLGWISKLRSKHSAVYNAQSRTWDVVVPPASMVVVQDGQQLTRLESASVASSTGVVLLVLPSVSSEKQTNEVGNKVPHQSTLVSARRLQQAASPTGDCALEVNGILHRFGGCQSVADGFEVYTGLSTDSRGQPVLLAGLSANPPGATAGTFWSGFGLAPDMGMVGSQVGIVTPDGTARSGASIAGYVLPGYGDVPVNNARGTENLVDASAEARSDGTLVAVYSIPLEQGTLAEAESVGARWVSFAVGPMENGELASHATGDSFNPYGLTSITPVVVAASADGPAAAPRVIESDRAPAPAPEGEEENVAEPPSPEQASAPSPPPQNVPTSTISPPSPPPPPQATNTSSCILSLGASNETPFSSCLNVARVGEGYNVFWTLDEETVNDANITVSWGMNTTQQDGYVAVGFPPQAGQMVGASAIVLAACPTCSGGVRIGGYYLGGQTPSSVQAPAHLAFTELTATQLPGGGMAGTFKLSVPASGTQRRRRLFQSSESPSQNIILASGPADDQGNLRMHYYYGSSTVPLTGGAAASVSTEDSLSGPTAQAHAGLLTIGWGVLIPLGIFTARYGKRWDPLWFRIHMGINLLGLVLGFVGFGLGFKLVGSWEAPTHKVAVHRNLGMAVVALGFVQGVLGFVRPKKDHHLRMYWQIPHHWLGRCTVILAITNIYYGYLNVGKLGVWPYAVYSGFLGVIVIVGVALDLYSWRERRRVKAASQYITSTNPLHSVEEGDGPRPSSDGSDSSGSNLKRVL